MRGLQHLFRLITNTASAASSRPPQDITFRRVTSDEDRHLVNVFLAKHIADPTAEPIPSRAVDEQLDIPSWAFVAEAHGDVVGAGFASNCPREVSYLLCEGEAALARAIQRSIVMLHQVAVDPEYQGKGIGRHLVELRETAARDAGARYSITVIRNTAQSRQHLDHLGYQVAAPGQTLIINVRPLHQAHGLPVAGTAVVWAAKQLRPTTAIRLSFR